MAKMGRPLKHFSVYREDKLIASGTAKECAEQMGIRYSSFFAMKARYLAGEGTRYIFIEEMQTHG